MTGPPLIRIVFLLTCLCAKISSSVYGQIIPSQNPDSVKAIKLSDIQTEYEKVFSEIPELVRQTTDTLVLHSDQQKFDKYSTAFVDIKKETDRMLKHYVSAWQIKNIESKLNRSATNFENLSEEVSSTATGIENNLLKIRAQLNQWTGLNTRLQNDPISKSLQPQVQEVMALLKNAEKILQKQLAEFLKIRNQTNQFQIENTQYINKINVAQENSIAKLLERDANFIWNKKSETYETDQSFSDGFKIGTTESIDYVREKWRAIVPLFILGTVLFFIFNHLKRKHVEEENVDPPLLVYNNITRFPIASSIITTLLVSFFILENRPALLTELLLIGFALPLIIFSFGKSINNVWIYWVLFLLYCFDVILLYIPLGTKIQNIVLVVTILLTIGMLSWMYKYPNKYLANRISSITQYIKTGFVPFFFYLACFTLIAGIVGYIELSKLLITGIVTSLYLGPVVLICSLIIRNFLQKISTTIVFENSFLVKKYLPFLIKLISFGAIILWFSSSLKGFGLFHIVQQAVQDFWDFGGSFGEFTITVGDVTSVILTLVISIILSDFIRVLLEDEMFSRIKVSRGVPMAIGVLGKYFVIVIGFFLAIASTGFDLTKMSIIAGALGVGVGFGLQNLVANFVSGMILIFERPILVGDIIEAEGKEGQVTQIGIRASKILTYAGAEVVVPNSNLINNPFSNWTLSNRKRRFTIEIRTNKNADPNEIVTSLTSIALEHSHIIKDPKPFVIFEGQLDQALLFKVYYWQVGELLSTRSELNLQIYSALKEKGIEISIPVYEIKKIE